MTDSMIGIVVILYGIQLFNQERNGSIPEKGTKNTRAHLFAPFCMQFILNGTPYISNLCKFSFLNKQ